MAGVDTSMVEAESLCAEPSQNADIPAADGAPPAPANEKGDGCTSQSAASDEVQAASDCSPAAAAGESLSRKTSSGSLLSDDSMAAPTNGGSINIDEDGGSPTADSEGAEIWDADAGMEKLGEAASCKEEGNRLLKEAKYTEAKEFYEKGLTSLSKVMIEPKLVSDIRLALQLNLSFAHLKLNEWQGAVKSSTEALKIEAANLKGLFRRGVARNRLGYHLDAKSDLLKVCELDPSNVDAKKELATLKKALADVKERERKIFNNFFGREGGVYGDKVKEVEMLRQAEAEAFAAENSKRQTAGDSPLKFDEWKKIEEKKKEELAKKASPSNNVSAAKAGASKLSKRRKSMSDDSLDEEEEKILKETKKKGYCYFDRPVSDETREMLASQNRPVKLTGSDQDQQLITELSSSSVAGSTTGDAADGTESSGRSANAPLPSPTSAISTWNQKGTTYEEKDCSEWCKKALTAKLEKAAFRNNPLDNVKGLQGLLATMGDQKESAAEDALKVAASLTPYSIKVTSVKSIEGLAAVAVIKASKRYIYDYHMELNWTLKLDDIMSGMQLDGDDKGQEKKKTIVYKGKLKMQDVASTGAQTIKTGSDPEDNQPAATIEWLVTAGVQYEQKPSSQHEASVRHALRSLKNTIYERVMEFENDFRASQ